MSLLALLTYVYSMERLMRDFALALWTTCIVLIAVGFGQPAIVVTAALAGWYYLSEVIEWN